jgi:hypothetical protein
MPPAVLALAPVVAAGIKAVVDHKAASAAADQQNAYQKTLADQKEAQNKAAWDAQQNSPQADVQRMGFNLRLGKLLGAMGGRDKVPPSLLKGLDAARAMPTYTPGAEYVAPPTTGGSGWDVAGGALNALRYYNPNAGKSADAAGAAGNSLLSTYKPSTTLANALNQPAPGDPNWKAPWPKPTVIPPPQDYTGD